LYFGDFFFKFSTKVALHIMNHLRKIHHLIYTG
jgi:hypothetical protein